jgi:hypothetical protein
LLHDPIHGSLTVSLGVFGLSLIARLLWPDLKLLSFQRAVVAVPGCSGDVVEVLLCIALTALAAGLTPLSAREKRQIRHDAPPIPL